MIYNILHVYSMQYLPRYIIDYSSQSIRVVYPIYLYHGRARGTISCSSEIRDVIIYDIFPRIPQWWRAWPFPYTRPKVHIIIRAHVYESQVCVNINDFVTHTPETGWRASGLDSRGKKTIFYNIMIAPQAYFCYLGLVLVIMEAVVEEVGGRWWSSWFR